jgi:hypothetical protein
MIITEQKLASHHPESAPCHHPIRIHTSHPKVLVVCSPIIIPGLIDPQHHRSS